MQHAISAQGPGAHQQNRRQLQEREKPTTVGRNGAHAAHIPYRITRCGKKKDDTELEEDNVSPQPYPATGSSGLQQVQALQEPQVKYASRPSVPFEQLRIKSSFSLNEARQNGNNRNEQQSAETPAAQSLPDVEVSDEAIRAAILSYAEAREKEGSRQIPVILRTAEIRFTAGTITLVLNNETQKEQFLSIRQNFLDELRLKVQSSRVSLEIDMSQQATETKAYKPVDIFKAMSEKNPALMELKKRFDLEIDY